MQQLIQMCNVTRVLTKSKKELDIQNNKSLQLSELPIPFGDNTIFCDMVKRHPRAYIPPSLLREIYQFHGLLQRTIQLG